MPTQTHTGVRDLLRNDVSRALFHLVREHLEERGSRPGRYGKLVIKQASEAAYIGVRSLNGGATQAELLHPSRLPGARARLRITRLRLLEQWAEAAAEHYPGKVQPEQVS